MNICHFFKDAGPSILTYGEEERKEKIRAVRDKVMKPSGSPMVNQIRTAQSDLPAGKKRVVRKNIDIFSFIPESVQVGFEQVLIALLSINLLVVLAVGISFGVQAFSVATKYELPEGVASLADKLEPVFTPALLSFFGVSVVLGSYKVAQLSRSDTEVRECYYACYVSCT